MKNKLKSLLYLYMIPLILAVFLAFVKDIQINGEELTAIPKVFIGFVVGMCLEGLLLVVGFTIAILTGKIN